MGEKIEITWRAHDGYAGGDRPQKTRIMPEDYELEMSDDEIGEIILDTVKNDFEERITLDLRTTDVEAVITKVRASLKAKKD